MAANDRQLSKADDNNNPRTSDSEETSTLNEKPRKAAAEAFQIDFCGTGTGEAAPSLQEAFERFRKQRQDNLKEQRRQLRHQDDVKRDPAQMEELRHKFLEQCKQYFGVPYARKYWAPDTPEYNSPVFLDCCGLIRRVLRDLHQEFGFRVGPWNQAYMFDTLPIALTESEMRPGDLVFMTGKYVNPKSKKQRHDMLHVEVWLGDGPKTIGARWNNGKVQVFDNYQFSPKSFSDEHYLFRSIDTWLQGQCKSHCDLHPWGRVTQEPGRKSIFFLQEDLGQEDQGAGDDEDDETITVGDDVTRERKNLGDAASESEAMGGSSDPDVSASATCCSDVNTASSDVSVTVPSDVKSVADDTSEIITTP